MRSTAILLPVLAGFAAAVSNSSAIYTPTNATSMDISLSETSLMKPTSSHHTATTTAHSTATSSGSSTTPSSTGAAVNINPGGSISGIVAAALGMAAWVL